MGLYASVAEGGHQIGGHPYVLQQPMEYECAVTAAGVPQDLRYADETRARYGPEERSWRLLLQVDSFDVMWGDSGILYTWMRDEEREARRFESAWTILQCC